MVKLCDYLNVTTDYILGKSPYKNYKDYMEHEKLVLKYLSTQTKEEYLLVTKTLNYINARKQENFEVIIDTALKRLPLEKKQLLGKVLFHLHYAYNENIPLNFQQSLNTR